MELLLAREELKDKPKKTTVEKVIQNIDPLEHNIIYFDKDNSHKNMVSAVDSLESEGYNVYFREIKFGLCEDEYMYELHVV